MTATHQRTVLLTGASGNWGRATLEEFRGRDHLKVLALSLDTPRDRRVLEEFSDMENLEVVWGNLHGRRTGGPLRPSGRRGAPHRGRRLAPGR